MTRKSRREIERDLEALQNREDVHGGIDEVGIAVPTEDGYVDLETGEPLDDHDTVADFTDTDP